MASFTLTNEIIGNAVRRGEMQMMDAAALFGSARQALHDVAQAFPGDSAVIKIAEGALMLGEQRVLGRKRSGGPV